MAKRCKSDWSCGVDVGINSVCRNMNEVECISPVGCQANGLPCNPMIKIKDSVDAVWDTTCDGLQNVNGDLL